MKIKKLLTALAVISLIGPCFAEEAPIFYSRVITISGDSVLVPANLFDLVKRYFDPGHQKMNGSGFFQPGQDVAVDNAAAADLLHSWGINVNNTSPCVEPFIPPAGVVCVNDNTGKFLGWYFPYAENWPVNSADWPENYDFVAADTANKARGNLQQWSESGFGRFLLFLNSTPYKFTDSFGNTKTASQGDLYFYDFDVTFQNSAPSNFEIITLWTPEELGKGYIDSHGNSDFALYSSALDSKGNLGDFMEVSYTVIRNGVTYIRKAETFSWKLVSQKEE